MVTTIKNNRQRNSFAAIDAAISARHGRRLDAEQNAALCHHKIPTDWNELTIELPRYSNTLKSASVVAGGGLVAEGFLAGWEIGRSARNPMRRYATVHEVPSGNTWRLATSEDAAGEGEMVAEGASGTVSDVSFGANVFRLKKFMSRPQKVAFELPEDSPNWQEQLGRVLSEEVNKIQNRKYTVGTGAGEPVGVVNAATSVSAASAAAISGDDLLNLILNAGDWVADSPTAAFMFHPTIFWGAVAKMKDASYIFPDTAKLFGRYPVILNAHMASSIASTARTAVFGDFARYHIAEAPLKLQVMRETNADADQVLYRAVQRSDGNIVDAGDTPFTVLVH